MRSPATALLALSVLALTGCGPTADDIAAMADGETTYDDALALRQDVVDAGVECPSVEQMSSPAAAGTTFLQCDGTMAMAVADSEERLAELLAGIGGEEHAPFLHEANWIVIARSEAPLEVLQAEIGGRITASP